MANWTHIARESARDIYGLFASGLFGGGLFSNSSWKQIKKTSARDGSGSFGETKASSRDGSGSFGATRESVRDL